MAKGNPLLGTLRRSIGDVTFFRRNGEQISRARIRQIANPRTDAQTIRRLAFSSASKTAQHLRGIVDHSFQGVKYGQASVNHFVSLLSKEIGTFMEGAIVDTSTSPFGTAPVLPFAAGGVACGAKALISSGDLAGMPFEFDSGSPGGILIGNSLDPNEWADISDLAGATIADYPALFGVPFSDQITFVVGAPVELDYISETELFYGVRFAVVRLNFNTDMPTHTTLFVTDGASALKFNTGVVDWTRTSPEMRYAQILMGQGQRMAIMQGSKDVTGTFADNDVCLCGVITSRYENNAWRRSTTRLVQTPKTITQSAVAYEQNYGYNDIQSTIELSVPQRKAAEDKYLNKEPNA